jgi:hypothetical protein
MVGVLGVDTLEWMGGQPTRGVGVEAVGVASE